MEHRCGQRQARREHASLTCNVGLAVIAQVRDVSASGAFLLTTLKWPLLAPIEVRLAGTRQPRAAHVVRQDPDGIGIEWEEFSPQVVESFTPSLQSEPATETGGPTLQTYA